MPPPPRLRREPVVVLRRMRGLAEQPADAVMLGDSLVATMPRDTALRLFPNAAFPGGIANLGVAGDTAADTLAMIRAEMPDRPGFRKALLLVGTNDLGRLAAEPIAATILEIAAELRHRGDAAVLVSGILPRGPGLAAFAEKIAAVNHILARECPAASPQFIDPGPGFRQACAGREPCPLFRDGVHMTAEGYATLADILLATAWGQAG